MAHPISPTGKTWLDLARSNVEHAQTEYVRAIRELNEQHNYSIESIAQHLGVSRSTVHRMIGHKG